MMTYSREHFCKKQPCVLGNTTKPSYRHIYHTHDDKQVGGSQNCLDHTRAYWVLFFQFKTPLQKFIKNMHSHMQLVTQVTDKNIFLKNALEDPYWY